MDSPQLGHESVKHGAVGPRGDFLKEDFLAGKGVHLQESKKGFLSNSEVPLFREEQGQEKPSELAGAAASGKFPNGLDTRPTRQGGSGGGFSQKVFGVLAWSGKKDIFHIEAGELVLSPGGLRSENFSPLSEGLGRIDSPEENVSLKAQTRGSISVGKDSGEGQGVRSGSPGRRLEEPGPQLGVGSVHPFNPIRPGKFRGSRKVGKACGAKGRPEGFFLGLIGGLGRAGPLGMSATPHEEGLSRILF